MQNSRPIDFKLCTAILNFDFLTLHFYEPERGVEPPTYSLPWSCSASELPGLKSAYKQVSKKANKLLIHFAFELFTYPLFCSSCSSCLCEWAGRDLHPRRRKPPRLQRGPFGCFGTNPLQPHTFKKTKRYPQG